MTKSEFLQKLKTELTSGMSASDIQEQLNYYGQYIDEEIGQGKDEAEVISELGDPWVIAKTILDASVNGEFVKESSGYESRGKGQTSREEGQTNQEGYKKVQFIGSGSKWIFLLVILGLIGIIMLLVAVVGGIISLLAPVLVPVLVIVFLIRILNRKR